MHSAFFAGTGKFSANHKVIALYKKQSILFTAFFLNFQNTIRKLRQCGPSLHAQAASGSHLAAVLGVLGALAAKTHCLGMSEIIPAVSPPP